MNETFGSRAFLHSVGPPNLLVRWKMEEGRQMFLELGESHCDSGVEQWLEAWYWQQGSTRYVYVRELLRRFCWVHRK
jgi:hypothetical protein